MAHCSSLHQKECEQCSERVWRAAAQASPQRQRAAQLDREQQMACRSNSSRLPSNAGESLCILYSMTAAVVAMQTERVGGGACQPGSGLQASGRLLQQLYAKVLQQLVIASSHGALSCLCRTRFCKVVVSDPGVHVHIWLAAVSVAYILHSNWPGSMH